MKEEIKNLFTYHPNAQKMTYWQHCKQAIIMSLQLLVASISLMIHAIFPFLLKKTASSIINKVKKKML